MAEVTREERQLGDGPRRQALVRYRHVLLRGMRLTGRSSKRKRPDNEALPIKLDRASGCEFSGRDFQELVGSRDWDNPRLQRLRDLAHKVNMDEPVF